MKKIGSLWLNELAAPIEESGKYMIPKSWLSEKQVLRLLQKTPAQFIYKRPGKGGGDWEYVSGGYVEKVLNYVFGWNWDFIVVQHLERFGQVITEGKLIVKDDRGHTIEKCGTGRADIKLKKNSDIPLDIGNDYKAADTDCLKKCASKLGIASDIYHKKEFQELGGQIEPIEKPKPEAKEKKTYDLSKPTAPAAQPDVFSKVIPGEQKIYAPQVKRFFSVVEANKIDLEKVKALLDKGYGIKNSQDIPARLFDEILNNVLKLKGE